MLVCESVCVCVCVCVWCRVNRNRKLVYIFLLKGALDSASQWSQSMIGVTINMLCYYYMLLRKYDWEISHKLLQCLRKCCGRLKHLSSLGNKEWRLPKQEKQSSRFCLAQAVLSQLLILKCCNVLIALFVSINSSQPDDWRSVFYSGKKVIVKLFAILNTGTCARIWSLRTSQLNKKQSEKPFLLCCLHDMKWGETYLLTPDD